MQIRDGVFSTRHPVFICVTHLETRTGSSHCTICDICSRLHYQAEAHTVKGSRRGRGYHNDLISMLSLRYHGPRCAAAPWDPWVCALLTALSMQHCVLHTQCDASCRLYYALSKLAEGGGGDQGYRCRSSGRRGSVRGAGDVVVLYGINAALAVPRAPQSLLPRRMRG